MITLNTTTPYIPPPPRTLIADDDSDILTALRLLLKNDGYEPETVSSPDGKKSFAMVCERKA